MPEVISRTAASSSSVGQTVAFRKDRGKQGKGESERHPSLPPRHLTGAATAKGSPPEQAKGHLVDIRA